MVQNGAYLKVLEEATRQNVQNLANLNPDKIVSPEIRAANGTGSAGPATVTRSWSSSRDFDPVVLKVMEATFQQLSRSGLTIERLFGVQSVTRKWTKSARSLGVASSMKW